MDTLYTYRCQNCRTVMTCTVQRVAGMAPYHCRGCLSYLRLVFSEPITTDAQRERARQGIVWNNQPTKPSTLRQCDECRAFVEGDTMIALGRFLRFCSPTCADLGTERHRRAMDQQAARLEALYVENPYLRPQAKEAS